MYISDKSDNKTRGTGLAIAKMLVEERLDGNITVYSDNKGTIFNIAI